MSKPSKAESIGASPNSRENEVLAAIQRRDWETLRDISLLPHGFGSARKAAWMFLLGVEVQDNEIVSAFGLHQRRPRRPSRSESASSPKSSDEESKIIPPVASSQQNHGPHPDEHQVQLDTDRSFVMYPYPVGKQREKEALKDQLHELIISVLRKRRKLGYFQGYHDVISVLYLTFAQGNGDVDSELFLCAEKISLHRLRDSMGKGLEPLIGYLRILKRLLRVIDPEFTALIERSSPLPYFALSNLLTLLSHDVPSLTTIQQIFDFLLSRPPISVIYLTAAIILTRKEEAIRLEQEGEEGMMHSMFTKLPEFLVEEESTKAESLWDQDEVPRSNETDEKASETTTLLLNPILKDETTIDDKESLNGSGTTTSLPELDLEAELQGNTIQLPLVVTDSVPLPQENEKFEIEDSVKSETIDSTIPIPPAPLLVLLPTPKAEPVEETARMSFGEDSGSSKKVSLTSILLSAASLMSQYPPTHPSIALSEIMGPQSVLLTWSENPSELPDDDDAENMTLTPILVVLPFEEEEDYHSERDKEVRDKRRRLVKKRRVRTGTLVAGVVVAVGVAAAVYGLKVGGVPNGQSKSDWRKAGAWIGSAALGVGQKMGDVVGL